MGKTRSRIEVRVWRFLSISEWSRNAFLLICWSRSLVSNFKIETKNDASVKCDFDVTIAFPNFEKFGAEVESEYDREIFGVGLESELNLSQ